MYLANYFISAHPGTRSAHALELAFAVRARRMHPEQVQDYLPLPMTVSSCMYYTGVHPLTGEAVYVPRAPEERRRQRAIVQHGNPANRNEGVALLRSLGKEKRAAHFFAPPLRTVRRGRPHRAKR